MVSQKKLKSITDMLFTDRSLGSVKQLISAAVSLSEKSATIWCTSNMHSDPKTGHCLFALSVAAGYAFIFVSSC